MRKNTIIILLSTLLVLTYAFLAMWFDDEIAGWWQKTTNSQQIYATPNVTILEDFADIKELRRKRTIRIYTPPGYENSTERYPVIYMNDGQRQFRNTHKDDERIDGILDKAIKDGQQSIIVVAIDQSEHRNTELNPYGSNNQQGKNEADILLKYIVKELKPYIDQEYRTLSDSSNTAISGESLGGLFAFYALMKYPDIFTMAGSLSPSFVHSHEPFYLPKYFPNRAVKIYLNVGEREFTGNKTVMKLMEKTLLETGFDSTNLRTKIVEHGNHDNVVWIDGFKNFYQWFFNEKDEK